MWVAAEEPVSVRIGGWPFVGPGAYCGRDVRLWADVDVGEATVCKLITNDVAIEVTPGGGVSWMLPPARCAGYGGAEGATPYSRPPEPASRQFFGHAWYGSVLGTGKGRGGKATCKLAAYDVVNKFIPGGGTSWPLPSAHSACTVGAADERPCTGPPVRAYVEGGEWASCELTDDDVVIKSIPGGGTSWTLLPAHPAGSGGTADRTSYISPPKPAPQQYVEFDWLDSELVTKKGGSDTAMYNWTVDDVVVKFVPGCDTNWTPPSAHTSGSGGAADGMSYVSPSESPPWRIAECDDWCDTALELEKEGSDGAMLMLTVDGVVIKFSLGDGTSWTLPSAHSACTVGAADERPCTGPPVRAYVEGGEWASCELTDDDVVIKSIPGGGTSWTLLPAHPAGSGGTADRTSYISPPKPAPQQYVEFDWLDSELVTKKGGSDTAMYNWTVDDVVVKFVPADAGGTEGERPYASPPKSAPRRIIECATFPPLWLVLKCDEGSKASGHECYLAYPGYTMSRVDVLVCSRLRTDWHEPWAPIGEATNPGPGSIQPSGFERLRAEPMPQGSVLAYPAPGTRSLAGAVAPGFTHDQDIVSDKFSLTVEAVNSTGWRALQRRMRATTAHALLAQEVWLTPDAIPAATAWAKRNGWKTIWTPAKAGKRGGASGGAAILVRDWMGLRPPPVGSHEWVPARVVAAVLEAPGHRPLLLVSSYLVHGCGPSPANVEILGTIGMQVQRQGPGLLLVMGGDMNMEPPDLALTSFDRQVDATIFPLARSGGPFGRRVHLH